MPIPGFTPQGQLPPGDHKATIKEVEERFTWTFGRRALYDGLVYVADNLTQRNVDIIWVDGSFVTNKERPRDVDVAYEVPDGTAPEHWGLFSPIRRHDLKKYMRVDLLPYWPGQDDIKQIFCHDRNGSEKGIIQLIWEAA